MDVVGLVKAFFLWLAKRLEWKLLDYDREVMREKEAERKEAEKDADKMESSIGWGVDGLADVEHRLRVLRDRASGRGAPGE